jgi:hypothetical protein
MKPKYYAYKVFKEVDGKLQSAGTLPDWLVYTYRLGKYNFPTIKHSHFFVFTELEQLNKFIKIQTDNKPLHLFHTYKVECFTKPFMVDKIPQVWLASEFDIDYESIKDYWSHFDFPNSNLANSFDGVHRTYGVKLIERL